MFNYNDYFYDEYQYALKKVRYDFIDTNYDTEQRELNISDSISTESIENKLKISFVRNVYFEPEQIYKISVEFTAILTFKDGKDSETLNWNELFSENENPYFSNIISRASNVIANLTSSYGMDPLITPPVLLNGLISE